MQKKIKKTEVENLLKRNNVDWETTEQSVT
jgi:hypothetical protein